MEPRPDSKAILECVKCLYSETHPVFIGPFKTKYIGQGKENGDYLELTCPRCGYTWRMGCADAKEAPDA